MNIFELLIFIVLVYAVNFILGGLAAILGINPLFLGLPAIGVGLGLIIKSKNGWALAVIIGISFGIGLYFVGLVGTPSGIAEIAAAAAAATLPVVSIFWLLIGLVNLFSKIVAWINRAK